MKKWPAISYPSPVCGSHGLSFLSASQSIVARIALPPTELASIASAFFASSSAFSLLLSSSASRASSSCASTSLGSLSSAFVREVRRAVLVRVRRHQRPAEQRLRVVF